MRKGRKMFKLRLKMGNKSDTKYKRRSKTIKLGVKTGDKIKVKNLTKTELNSKAETRKEKLSN